LLLVAIPAALTVLSVIDTGWLEALFLFEVVLVFIAGLDAGYLWLLTRRVRCGVECQGVWSIDRDEEVVYHLDSDMPVSWRVRVVPDLPREFVAAERSVETRLQARRRVVVRVPIRARSRGEFTIGKLWLALPSVLALWNRHRCIGEDRRINVYPNLKQLGEYALLARTNRLGLIGVRRIRRVGGDTEFERLRDYQHGDSLHSIDWKATARRDELTVRDYQITQSQTVVFLVDAGRMMVARPQDGGELATSLLDRSIDAVLMMAYVALAQNDRVGLIVYSDRILRSIKPQGGARHIVQLIHALHDIEPELVESRHDLAFLHLQRHERKRSLSVLFTNVIDQVNADMLETHLATVGRRHLPMAVMLRDPDVARYLSRPPVDEDDFWNAGAAADIACWRRGVLEGLEQQGSLVVDSELESLTPAVVSSYLEVKARHLL